MGRLTITAQGTIFNGHAVSGGSGAGNLLTPDPREVWVCNSSTSASVLFDFGSPQSFDSIFLGFTNLQPGANWSVASGATSAASDSAHIVAQSIVEPIVAYGFDRSIGRIVHLYAKLPDVVTARYVRIDMAQSGGGLPNIRAGILVVNRCFQPTWPQELGAGRMVIDTASRDRLPGGGFAIGDGVIKSSFQFTLGDLDDAEVQAIYALARINGERRPVLVVEDPDVSTGLQERIRWCVLDRLEAYERRGAGLTRWGLRVEDWA